MASFCAAGWLLGRSLAIFGAFALILVIFATNLYKYGAGNAELQRLVKSSLKDCSCTRTIISTTTNHRHKTSNCDASATFRGAGQKVLAYSFYGDSSKSDRVRTHYLEQIQDRASEIASRYPGWLMRVYFSLDEKDTISQSAICDIWCTNQHVDLCDVSNLPDPKLGDLKSQQPIGIYLGHLHLFWSYICRWHRHAISL